jgi:hypothetical protein
VGHADDSEADGRRRVERQRQQATRRNLGSSLIFAALAVVLVAIAGYLWYEENNAEDSPTAPPPNPEIVGRIETINVLDALISQDLDAELGRSSVRASHLRQPGQPITIGSDTLYVFVYTSVPARESDSSELEPESLVLTSVGTPVPGGDAPPHVITKGNIIAVLIGGDDELREKVDAAIASLPEVGESTTPEAAFFSDYVART